MKQLITFSLIFLSSPVFADDCLKISKYNEINSEIFVICPDLPTFDDDKALDTVRKIFSSRKFVPDEYVLYFVTDKKVDSRKSFTPDNLVGLYYTHDNELKIWPNVPAKKRVIQLSNKK